MEKTNSTAPSFEELDTYMKESTISITNSYGYSPEVLKIGDAVIGTLGNFSASIGKAKSKKTFNVSAIVASALSSGTVLRYNSDFPEDKRSILYVDTEQGRHHCQKVLERILRLAHLPEDVDPKNLRVLALRKYTPEMRLAIVEHAINTTPELGFVIIDGIRDFIHDINSPSEASEIISKLMQWTDDKQIHIHTVLHQNKNDEHARGHIGTELSNKAETVMQVEVGKEDSSVSIVEAIHIRDREFKPFAFRINNTVLPELVESFKVREKKVGRPPKEKFDPYTDITEQQHRTALEAAFAFKTEYGYEELLKVLVKTYGSVDVCLNYNKAVSLITMLRNKRMVVQEQGRKYSFMPDFRY